MKDHGGRRGAVAANSECEQLNWQKAGRCRMNACQACEEKEKMASAKVEETAPIHFEMMTYTFFVS